MSQLTPKQTTSILENKLEGKSNRQIARELKVSRTTVNKYVNEPFFLTLTSKQEEQLKRIQTKVFDLLEQLPNDIGNKLKENESQRNTLTYIKLLNTAINYIDKTNRALDTHKPSKQVSIEQYSDHKLVQFRTDNE